MTTAIGDMQTAYTTAAGRTSPDYKELGAGNIGGLTLKPGLYKWSSTVKIGKDVTISGGVNDVWVFQIAQTLDLASGTKVILKGGAQAKNIFWIVAGQTTLGATSVLNGIVLDKTAIVFKSGATLNGRALAQTAVTLIADKITAPTAAIAIVDKVSPVITMRGANPINVTQKTTYSDAGATALDNVDGAVTVTTSGTVNIAVIGTYTITYSAKDHAGNSAIAKRTVKVVAKVAAK